MPDKRPVDDLSLEELERVLAIKRREERQTRLQRMKQRGRVIETPVSASPQPTQPQQEQTYASDGQGLPAATVELGREALTKRKTVPEFEEAIDSRNHTRKRQREANRIWRMFVDRLLILTEAAAVIGLVVLGVALFNGLNILQEETADAQAAAEDFRSRSIPTLAPTPTLRLSDVVLPTGHIVHNGVPQFNFAEVPEQFRWQVAQQVLLPEDIARPQPTDDTPLRLLIPRLNIDNAIVQGVDWDALKQGVGMLPNGAVPRDANGNVVLAAHNDIYGQIFRYLDQLQPGDEIQLMTRSGVYTYRIRSYQENGQTVGHQIVKPDEVHVMQSQGAPILTLISCYPYQKNTERIIIQADRVDL